MHHQNKTEKKAWTLQHCLIFFLLVMAQTMVGTQDDEYRQRLDELSAKEYKTAVDYYNMGVCAHHLNEPYVAAVFWSYASEHANQELKNEIDSCMRQEKCNLIEVQRPWLFDFVRQFPILPIQVLAIMSVLLLIACGICVPRFLVAAWIFFILSCFSIALVYYANTLRIGVVALSSDVRAGPATGYMKISQLSQGSTVDILEQHKSWCKVRGTSQKGWVERDHLICI